MPVRPLVARHEREDSATSFDDFYRQFYVRVLVLMRKHFPGCDPEDVAQETMTRCYSHFDAFDPARDPWPWVASVARNTAIDVLRRNRRQAPVEDVAGAVVDVAHDATYDAMLTRERRRSLFHAMGRLKPADRQLIEDHDLDGIGCAEIAAIRDLTPNALRQQLHRARRRLAVELRRAGAALGIVGGGMQARFTRLARRLNEISMAAGTASESAMGLVAAATVTASVVAAGLGLVAGPAHGSPTRPAAVETAVVAPVPYPASVAPALRAVPTPAVSKPRPKTFETIHPHAGPTDVPVTVLTSGDPMAPEPNEVDVYVDTPAGRVNVVTLKSDRTPGWNIMCYFGLVPC